MFTLHKKLFLSVLGITLLACTFVAGQNTDKRNSPFAPNPKKKVGQPENKNTVASEPQTAITKAPEVIEPKDEVKKPIETADAKAATEANGSSTEFESRSVASKTLEIAKRASTVKAAPTEIYKIGAGDVLTIRIQNAQARESAYFTVLKDGTIDYPLAGEPVLVTGMTTEEVEDALKERVKLYENPQISVKIREHNSHVFNVLGLVDRPGEKSMQREAIPLFMIRAEAIVKETAKRVLIRRNGAEPENLALGDSKTDDYLIFPGDVVEFVGDNAIGELKSGKFFYIGGEINAPGQRDFHEGMTLTQGILASGGLKKVSVRKVVVRRKNAEGLLVPQEFDLKSIKEGKAVDPVLQPGDTIEVGIR